MMYQTIMNIGGKEPRQISSGIWESSYKAWDELAALAFSKIPFRTSWQAWLVILK